MSQPRRAMQPPGFSSNPLRALAPALAPLPSQTGIVLLHSGPLSSVPIPSIPSPLHPLQHYPPSRPQCPAFLFSPHVRLCSAPRLIVPAPTGRPCDIPPLPAAVLADSPPAASASSFVQCMPPAFATRPSQPHLGRPFPERPIRHSGRIVSLVRTAPSLPASHASRPLALPCIGSHPFLRTDPATA